MKRSPNFSSNVKHLKIRKKRLTIGHKTLIMGIINLTPDSFSGDGCYARKKYSLKNVLHLADKMISEGASILDLGGESSRPGAVPVSEKDETARVIPVVSALSKRPETLISVDTYKTSVAQRALDNGAHIINNIRGIDNNRELLKLIGRYQAGIVLMHMRGTPQTMQKNTRYNNLIKEMIGSLKKAIENCLENGIKSDKIIIDPGIGFGKTAQQNLLILNHLKDLKILKKPILIGPSRKSFIGKITGCSVEDRLAGTLSSISVGIVHGADIVRVHDVRAAKQAVMIADGILQADH